MSASWTISGAQVVRVFSEDLARPGCVARTLVSHPDLPTGHLLLPVRADNLRISGILMAVEALDPGLWRSLDPPLPWDFACRPVVAAGTVVFIPHEDLEAQRLQELAEVVERVLTNEQAPLIDRVAAIEHADGLVGGHPVTSAALLALGEEATDAAVLGDPPRLRHRFHEVAPDGLDSLRRALNHLSVRGRISIPSENRLTGAATRADQPNGSLQPDAWQRCAEATLWSWWLHWKAGIQNSSVRSLGRNLGLGADALARLVRAEATPDGLGVSSCLPKRGACLDDLRRAHAQTPAQHGRVRLVQRSHVARLSLFARQLGEMDRALGRDRLTRWIDTREVIRTVRESLALRSFSFPWQAAEFAANQLRLLVSRLDIRDAVSTTMPLLGSLGVDLASAVLPHAGQQGGWSAPTDGAPVLYLTPAALALSPGAVRFAVFHQLGHLVEGHDAPCSRWAHERLSSESDTSEAFANAFAAYFMAPRDAVISLVGGYGHHLLRTWVQQSAREVAIHFGIGPEAALAHLVNCLGRSPEEWLKKLANDHGWIEWCRVVRLQLPKDWRDDAEALRSTAGGTVESTVERALCRPMSPRFDALLSQAAAQGQVQRDLPQRFAVS